MTEPKVIQSTLSFIDHLGARHLVNEAKWPINLKKNLENCFNLTVNKVVQDINYSKLSYFCLF